MQEDILIKNAKILNPLGNGQCEEKKASVLISEGKIAEISEDIENADDVLSKALSDKINEFLQSGEYVSQIKYKYEIYSNFYKLMQLAEWPHMADGGSPY